jgi:hypothetical protein
MDVGKEESSEVVWSRNMGEGDPVHGQEWLENRILRIMIPVSVLAVMITVILFVAMALSR